MSDLREVDMDKAGDESYPVVQREVRRKKAPAAIVRQRKAELQRLFIEEYKNFDSRDAFISHAIDSLGDWSFWHGRHGWPGGVRTVTRWCVKWARDGIEQETPVTENKTSADSLKVHRQKGGFKKHANSPTGPKKVEFKRLFFEERYTLFKTHQAFINSVFSRYPDWCDWPEGEASMKRWCTEFAKEFKN